MKHNSLIFYILFIVTIFTITFIACDNGLETVENYDANGNLVEVYTRDKKTLAKQGAYFRYDDAGIIIEEAQFTNDTLNGRRIIYYENQRPQVVENYYMGAFHGLYQTYYENGALANSGWYVDGKKDGDWIRKYENGQQMETVLFENDLENGSFTEWYKNGNLKARGQYKNGTQEHGKLELYDRGGRLRKELLCDNGICRTTWKKDDEENSVI